MTVAVAVAMTVAVTVAVTVTMTVVAAVTVTMMVAVLSCLERWLLIETVCTCADLLTVILLIPLS